MKRQKLLKVAGGALAAAMSLAMLAGCSGNTTSGSSSTGETGTARGRPAALQPQRFPHRLPRHGREHVLRRYEPEVRGR